MITRKARALLHSIGLTPTKPAVAQKVSDRFGNGEGIPRSAFLDMIRFLDEELLGEDGATIRIPVDQKADVLFVTGSGEIYSHPETVLGCAVFFHVAGIDWTMNSKAFDAANFGLVTGDDAHMKRRNKLLHDACLRLEAKKFVIGECGHAYRVAKHMGGVHYWGEEAVYEVTSIFKPAADVLRIGGLRLDPGRNTRPVSYHDRCNFARSTGLIEEPRELLRACVTDFREISPNLDLNWCCGRGGGLAVLDGRKGVSNMESTFHEHRMKVAGRKKFEQIVATEAARVPAPCGNCRRQITQLMEYHGQDVQVGAFSTCSPGPSSCAPFIAQRGVPP